MNLDRKRLLSKRVRYWVSCKKNFEFHYKVVDEQLVFSM